MTGIDLSISLIIDIHIIQAELSSQAYIAML